MNENELEVFDILASLHIPLHIRKEAGRSREELPRRSRLLPNKLPPNLLKVSRKTLCMAEEPESRIYHSPSSSPTGIAHQTQTSLPDCSRLTSSMKQQIANGTSSGNKTSRIYKNNSSSKSLACLWQSENSFSNNEGLLERVRKRVAKKRRIESEMKRRADAIRIMHALRNEGNRITGLDMMRGVTRKDGTVDTELLNMPYSEKMRREREKRAKQSKLLMKNEKQPCGNDPLGAGVQSDFIVKKHNQESTNRNVNFALISMAKVAHNRETVVSSPNKPRNGINFSTRKHLPQIIDISDEEEGETISSGFPLVKLPRTLVERNFDQYLTSLTKHEKFLLKKALNASEDEVVAYFQGENIMLYGRSFRNIRQKRWFDDEIINAYVSMINERNRDLARQFSRKNRDGIPNAFCFNSFFFTKLSNAPPKGINYEGVQK